MKIIKIENKINEVKKKRVAIYARVSTDKLEQYNSYEAQVNYYAKYVNSKNEYMLVGIYTDIGITGTSIKKRPGFIRMVNDALDNKIDLIITKSISRFARNTVDSLTTVRKLKEHNVEVYFEKENIYTLDSKGELLLTIMSSLAQEESRSISQNVTWGMRKWLANGNYRVPFSSFLGYDRGKNGKLIINEKEALIVKRIYKEFLEGKSCYYIAKDLTLDHIPSPMKKSTWYTSTIRSILSNEKYVGDAKLQKTYTDDYLTKKKCINNGEVAQYYIKNVHKGIIDRNTFNKVQVLLNNN